MTLGELVGDRDHRLDVFVRKYRQTGSYGPDQRYQEGSRMTTVRRTRVDFYDPNIPRPGASFDVPGLFQRVEELSNAPWRTEPCEFLHFADGRKHPVLRAEGEELLEKFELAGGERFGWHIRDYIRLFQGTRQHGMRQEDGLRGCRLAA